MKKVLVPIADGVEEIETITLIDVFRRASYEVTVASIHQLDIIASRNVNIKADCKIDECVYIDYDLIVVPGGLSGAENLRDSSILKQILDKQIKNNRFFGAICASPAIVLSHHNMINDKNATCYPGFENQLKNQKYVNKRVVHDGNCITSQGPGTAMEYALYLVELLSGRSKKDELARSMLVNI